MRIIDISEVKDIVQSGNLIAVGGFTINRKPIKILKEISESKLENLSIFTLAGSIDVDLMLINKKLKKIFAAYVGYEGLGISKILRDFVENKKVEFEDLTEILYHFSLKAGANDLKYLPTKSILNTDIMKISSLCEEISINGEKFCGVKAINPDVCIIHAQRADKEGNIFIDGPLFSELEMAMASKKTIFSVEEIGELNSDKIAIPKEFVDYVVHLKKGAAPTTCNGFYSPEISSIRGFMKDGKI